MAYTTINKSTDHFNTVTYSNAGDGAKAVTGVGFQPDLVWVKNRTLGYNAQFHDAVRGASNGALYTNTTAAVDTGYPFSSFDSDGFTTGAQGSNESQNSASQVAWNWKAGSTAPAITYVVKVVSDSGNKYRFDDFGTSAVTLDLQEGGTYTFDQADSSNSGHPLRFYTASDKSGGEYTTGVTTNGTPGSSGAYTQIDVDEDTPSILYYQCSSHAYMGNHAVVLGSNKINHSEALIDMPTSSGTLALTSQLLTTGISSGNVGTFASGVADNDFLRIDGTSIEGRSASEVLSDIGVTFGISNTNTVKIDSSSVANGEFAKFTANGLESRSTSELASDIGAATTDDIIALSIALG